MVRSYSVWLRTTEIGAFQDGKNPDLKSQKTSRLCEAKQIFSKSNVSVFSWVIMIYGPACLHFHYVLGLYMFASSRRDFLATKCICTVQQSRYCYPYFGGREASLADRIQTDHFTEASITSESVSHVGTDLCPI